MIIDKKNYIVRYTEDGSQITRHLNNGNYKHYTFDTETTGLHLKKDRPFLGAVCFGDEVWVFPTTKEVLSHMKDWSKGRMLVAHNTTYDMHMVANIMGDEFVLGLGKFGDTMGMCRLSFEAISMRDGGDSLSLKTIAKKYIDNSADRYEHAVKKWLKQKEAQDKKILIALLKFHGWSLKRYQDALDGKEDIPMEVVETHNEWKRSYPKPNYSHVPMDIMMPYLAVDVILTKQLAERTYAVIQKREQVEVMEREFANIPITFKTERAGIKVDQNYLQESKYKLEQYIEDLRLRAYELSDKTFNSGQHNVIKEIYSNILDYTPATTDKAFLKRMANEGDELAPVLMKWRTAEKWLSTYIHRIADNSEHDGRFYSQLGQFHPVSGRFSGDAQQFPRGGLFHHETGEELFVPRKAFVPTGNGYDSIYYMDFSQVELRVQSHYTLFLGGDTNLCRAYMPFKCIHAKTMEVYDHTDEEGRKRWNEKLDGHSVWINPDTREPWVPTDVHTQTTVKALEKLGIDKNALSADEFKKWRNVGKTFNFMRNYGGGYQKASDVLEISIDEAKAMADGYTDSFPLVIGYQDKVVEQMFKNGYVQNMYGRRYYLSDQRRYYKCANYLIQGTCADDLKDKLIKINDYLVSNNLKTRILMYVHDEIQYEVYNGEEHHLKHIKAIMEYTPMIHVPIISEVEKTTTSWADKKGVEL